MIDAGRFAAVLGALWTAHDLGDHLVQTDHQAAGKSTSWRAMAGHITGYGATQAAALGLLHAAGVRLRPGRALAGLALSLGTHAFLDRRWPVVRVLERTGSAGFANPSIDLPEMFVSTEAPWMADVRQSNSGKPPGGLLHGYTQGGRAALPLHGPYLADQAIHHVCVALAAAVIA